MASRKKRLEKQAEGLIKQAEKHKLKVETFEGRKDTTHDYWLKEAERFEERARQRQAIIEKLDKKKSEEEKETKNK